MDKKRDEKIPSKSQIIEQKLDNRLNSEEFSNESNLKPIVPPCDKTAKWQSKSKSVKKCKLIFPVGLRELEPDEQNNPQGY